MAWWEIAGYAILTVVVVFRVLQLLVSVQKLIDARQNSKAVDVQDS